MGCRAWGCGGHGQVWGHGGMAGWRHGGQQGSQRLQAKGQGLAGRAGRYDCLPAPCQRRTLAYWENPYRRETQRAPFH
jgi:hypothetical protein